MGTSDKLPGRYPVPGCGPGDPWLSELTIRKSLFITRSFHCNSAVMAREFIARLRESEADASHHCWAFVAGPPGDTAKIGFSDDGEPHGTAGRPMLNVLLHCGAGQICSVVSRWFGGIKLGTGGLARAYQQAVRENLESLPLIELVSRESWKIVADYASLNGIKRFLQGVEACVRREEYRDKAEFVVEIPRDKSSLLASGLAELSNGAARLQKLPSLPDD